MLIAQPIHLAEANAFVADHHRHSKPVKFHLFSIAALDGFRLCGVVIVMRPVNQHRAFGGWVCEVARLCTDGTKNAPSFLLARAAEAAFAMGHAAIQTYTLPSESGASMKAAGWACMGVTKARSWCTEKRSRPNAPLPTTRLRWKKDNIKFLQKAERLLERS